MWNLTPSYGDKNSPNKEFLWSVAVGLVITECCVLLRLILQRAWGTLLLQKSQTFIALQLTAKTFPIIPLSPSLFRRNIPKKRFRESIVQLDQKVITKYYGNASTFNHCKSSFNHINHFGFIIIPSYIWMSKSILVVETKEYFHILDRINKSVAAPESRNFET